MLKRPFKSLIARIAIIALALSLVVPFVPAAFADSHNTIELDYAENGTAPITTFFANDEEGDAVTWGLEGDDAAKFEISEAGVLTFKDSPNFEDAQDDDRDNVYEVTVTATAATTGRQVVQVTVTDVDEAGTVSLDQPQPQVGRDIAAELDEPDAGETDLNWQWSRGAEAEGPWTDIDAATNADRTPTSDDNGMYLRATATYEDKFGTGKEVSVVSENPVEGRTVANAAPTFADHNDEDITPDNTDDVQAVRDVDEGEEGANVGKALNAKDADDDILLYSIDTVSQANFTIDPRTGQLKTKVELNSDDDGNDATFEDATFTVTVTATDPSSATGTAIVTVNVNDVNDSPMFPAASAEAHSIAENADPLTLGEPYAATDDDMDDTSESITYGVTGADADDFTISNDAGDRGQLSIKEDVLNFEEKSSYSITITATDGEKASAELDVTVTVTNAEDDGVITLTQRVPQVGRNIVASLSDEDGGTSGVSWQWYRNASDTTNDDALAGATTDCVAATDTLCRIPNATTPSYTPAAADIVAAASDRKLAVRATYTDEFVPDPVADDSAYVISQANAQISNPANSAPDFGDDQDPNTPGDQADVVRSVAENVKAASVGDAVTATDADVNELSIYSLSGPDSGSFTIDSGLKADDTQGQIKTAVKLDYESRSTYMVVVTATDPSGATDTINVVINVTDEDDEPVITGDKAVDYAENGTDPVATYSATDQDGHDITWGLEGEDAADFEISNVGVLTFEETPNFEKAADDDTDNEYEVTVTATGNVKQTLAVVVTVTDVDEDGKVTLDQPQPQVGRDINTEFEDVDAGETDRSWQWARGESAAGPWTDIAKATSDSRTPTSDDVGMYLRATVTYTDKFGSGKTASAVSENSVEARTVANAAPTFADHNVETITPEVTDDLQAVRDVDEGVKGANVGKALGAKDADNDVLLYSLGDTDVSFDLNGDGTATETPVEDVFTIDPRTGQLKTKVELNSDDSGTTGDDDDNGEIRFEVTVTATDPSSATGSATVTITVNDVNDKPAFDEDAQKELWVLEGLAGATFTLRTGEASDATVLAEGEYVAGDADAGDAATTDANASPPTVTLTYDVGGADGDSFSIDTAGVLSVKADHTPNYEEQSSYSITIMASDDQNGTAELEVTVTVTNAEDAGSITLTQREPQVGRTVVASLTDEDGGTSKVTWQWYRNAQANTQESAVTAIDACNDDTANNALCRIPNATSPSYMPVADDAQDPNEATDAANRLAARVTYFDKFVTDTGDPGDDGDSAFVITQKDVQVSEPANTAPAFDDDQDPATAGDQGDAVRSVPENDKGVNVGDAVTAMDGDGDAMIYSISGPDADSFTIDSGLKTGDSAGQIETKVELDFEAKNTYVVVVTATDPSGAADSINVIINVTDEDDKPVISQQAPVPPIVPADGSVTLSSDSPAVGEAITATLEDGNEETGLTWQWSNHAIGDEAYADIEGATDASYTPTAADFGKHVRATASYSDDSSEEGQTAMAATANLVNNAPAFDAETASISVDENSEAMAAVGDPIVATDVNEEELAYTLTGDDAASFAIWPSGQITVAPDAAIDYETKTSYSVTVTATDAADASASIEVTIAVNDLGLSNAYDSNDSGDIDKDEAVEAVQDYFADTITRGEVLTVLQLYFAG